MSKLEEKASLKALSRKRQATVMKFSRSNHKSVGDHHFSPTVANNGDTQDVTKHDKEKIMKYLQKDVKQRDIKSIHAVLSSFEFLSLADLDENGQLLKYAARYNYLDVMEVLLKYNSPVGYNGTCGLSVLHQAVKYGRMDTLQLLLRNHVDVNQVSLYEQKTSLHLAVKQDNINLVLLLLSYGADPNKPDIYGCAPIHTAASYGCDDMVSTLIHHQADVNALDRVTWTPLHHSAEMNNASTVRLLLQNRANISAQTRYGKTPLHLACQRGHLAVIDVLLAYGCLTEITDIHGKRAAEYTDNDLIISLLDTSTKKQRSSESDTPIRHIDMTLRSKSLIDLLEPEYVKDDYYNLTGDQSDAKHKSMPSMSIPQHKLLGITKKKAQRKTISNAMKKIFSKNGHGPSSSHNKSQLTESIAERSDLNIHDFSRITGKSMEYDFNSTGNEFRISPRCRPSIIIQPPCSTPRDSKPMNRSKYPNRLTAGVSIAPPCSTPRNIKPGILNTMNNGLCPPSSTPRNSKPPQNPQFLNHSAGLDMDNSSINSISDMEISAMASSCQYSNTNLSKRSSCNDLSEYSAGYKSDLKVSSMDNNNRKESQTSINWLSQGNKLSTEKNSHFTFDHRRPSQASISSAYMYKPTLEVDRFSYDGRRNSDTLSSYGTMNRNYDQNRPLTPVEDCIASISQVTDQCITSITDVTEALHDIKKTDNKDARFRKLANLTTFLNQWAIETADYKLNFKNNNCTTEC